MSDKAVELAKVFAGPLLRIAAAIPLDIDRASRGKLERSLETISDAIADLPGKGDFYEDFAVLIRETMKPGVGDERICPTCSGQGGEEPHYCRDCNGTGELPPAPELPWPGPYEAFYDSEGFWMIRCGDGRVVIDPVICLGFEPEDVAAALAAVLNAAQKGK